MVNWSNENQESTFAEIVFGGDNGKSISLKKAHDNFVETSGATGPKMYGVKSAYNKYSPILGENRDINSICVGEWDKVMKYYSKKGQAKNTLITMRSHFLELLRWANTGKLSEGKPKSTDTVALKISRSHIDNLIDVLPSKSGGRFFDLKMEVKSELLETPKDQFAMVHLPSGMTEDKKEYTAARLTIAKMLADHKMEWRCIYSNNAKALLLIRKSQWADIKKRRVTA